MHYQNGQGECRSPRVQRGEGGSEQECWAGAEKRREGKKCSQKRLEAGRERQQHVPQPPAPSPQGHAAVPLCCVCRGF